MKIYTLSTREEIRAAIETEFMVAELKNYAVDLTGFFCDKVEAWMAAYRTGSEKRKEEAEEKYGTEAGKVRYELETAMDDLKKVMRFRSSVDDRINICVTDITDKPIVIEGDGDDNEGDLHMQWIDAMLQREMQFKGSGGEVISTHSFLDIISPYDIMGLYDHTVGIVESVSEEYHDLFNRYL